MVTEATGSAMPGGIDLNALLQSAVAGGSMSNLLGGDNGGSQFVMGALLGRLLFNNGLDGNGNQNADRAAIDSAVSAALANANQANNNFGTLLKDIQDSSQEVMSTITNGNQNLLVQQLQVQIATMQGQSDIKQAIAVGNANIVNEVHEGTQTVTNQLDVLNTNMLQGLTRCRVKLTAT